MVPIVKIRSACLVGATSLVLACGAQTPSSTQAIIGTSDLTPVDDDASILPRTYRTVADAVGKVLPGSCTATHIGLGRVLTAGHCVDAVGPMEEDVGCQGYTITWNFRAHRPSRVSYCTRIAFRQVTDLGDVAILEVDSPPAASAEVDFRPLRDRAEITVLSHPQGRRLEWSGHCRVNPPGVPAAFPGRFVHVCDTEGGSSGAPVVDVASGHLVGIHNGGNTERNFASAASSVPGRFR